jgi:hypothetical protein
LRLNITGYQFLTTSSPFSRVAFYLRNDNHVVPVVCRGDGNEVITLDFDDMLLTGVYRPFKVEPGSNLTYQFEKILNYLDVKLKTISKKKKVLIREDFNQDFKRHGDGNYGSKVMLNRLGIWAASHGLSQQVKASTRYRIVQTKRDEGHEESTLDHLYSNDEVTPNVIIAGTSDHLAIATEFKLQTKTSETVKLKRRDWRRYGKKHFNKAIENQDIKVMIEEASKLEDPDELNEKITSIHRCILDEFSTLPSVQVT